jgi:hypothetical protein
MPLGDDVYGLADAGFTPIAGNLKGWPAVARAGDGWVEFSLPNWRSNS